MTQPTVSDLDPGQRFRMAGQLDEVIRELQVLQHVLRVGEGTMPLATLSTGLIGAKITLGEVSDTVGVAEGDAIGEVMVAKYIADCRPGQPVTVQQVAPEDWSMMGPSI